VSGLDVDAGTVRDVFVRHIPHGADPLHQPSHPADGRWQRGRLIEAWYFADEPGTAWAEWYRALAGTGVSPVHTLPRDLWRWRIDLDRVALLDSDERPRAPGLLRHFPRAPNGRPFRPSVRLCIARASPRCSSRPPRGQSTATSWSFAHSDW
jgi:hypothetical protein